MNSTSLAVICAAVFVSDSELELGGPWRSDRGLITKTDQYVCCKG